MKKILLTALACLSLSASNAQTWTAVGPSSGVYYACSFASPTTVYVCGASGGSSLIKSTDVGISFSPLSATFIPSSMFPMSCEFTSADTGCIAGGEYITSGYLGYINRTTDGGMSWTSVATCSTASFCHMAFPSRLIGYAVAGSSYAGSFNGSIYKTTDGGATWTSIFSTSSASLLKISMINDSTGYAVGQSSANQARFITIRNGTVFSDSTVGAYRKFSAVYFRSLDTGFVCANTPSSPYNVRILKTTDAGISWSVAYTDPSYYEYNDIKFANAAVGYAIGSHNAITTDSGNTWAAITLPTATGEANALDFRNNIGIIVGEGFVIRNGAITVTPIVQNPAVRYDLFPNPVTGLLHLSFKHRQINTSILIVDVVGREIKHIPFTGKDLTIETTDLKAGTYLVHIFTAEGDTATTKLLVQ
jgi:photosystem II stability/assembly factor-like uncharacterized protein